MKMLLYSTFPFSLIVFKRPLSPGRTMSGSCGKELILYQTMTFETSSIDTHKYKMCSENYIELVLTHYQATNFRPFQTERVGRGQFQI